jgi:molybdopterin synthase catalytic subunit
MRTEIEVTAGSILPSGGLPEDLAGLAGAVAEFWGIVRADEEGAAIAALEYEAYQPMAERVMRDMLDDLGRRHPCLFVRVRHRVGVVPVGEAALHVLVAARHRAAAFAMLGEFMDRLKQDVPIWKRRTLPQLPRATPEA